MDSWQQNGFESRVLNDPDSQMELKLLACCMRDPQVTEKICEATKGSNPFSDPVAKLVFPGLKRVTGCEYEIDISMLKKKIDEEASDNSTVEVVEILDIRGMVATSANSNDYLKYVIENWVRRTRKSLLNEAYSLADRSDGKAYREKRAELERFDNEFEGEKVSLRKQLAERRFDIKKVPSKVDPVFTLAGKDICTQGNITTITAQVKAGKSAFCSAMISAAIADGDQETDTLGLEGGNHEGKALIYCDTEQSPDDFWHLVKRAMDRAEVSETPDWFEAYTIADLGPDQAREAVQLLMDEASERHNGIYAVIIDGVADLIHDVNDSRESNALVSELHSAAIRRKCAIICVIHLNPLTSKGTFTKATGHLGSRLEKKAESNLKLEKVDELTLVWSDKQRKAPILKTDGIAFRWDDDLKMHVSAVVQTSASLKDQELYMIAEEVFAEASSMRYKDLSQAIVTARGVSGPTANRKIAQMKSKGMISLSCGYYSLVKDDGETE